MTPAFLPVPPLRASRRQSRVNSCTPRCSIMSDHAQFSAGVSMLQSEGAYAVLAAANALEARTGENVVHLEIGQPAFHTPAHISDAAISAIRNGDTKYTHPAGVPLLRAAIADAASRETAIPFTPANVVVGPGAKPGLFFATLALVRGPHDHVVLPDPGFPTYTAMTHVARGTPVHVPLRQDLASFDMDALRKAVGPQTRLLVLNSPANPTGGVIPEQDLREIAQLAQRFDFWVLSDEIYSALHYLPQSPPSIISFPGMRDRTVVINGFSKSYCMTGWRLGWAIAPVQLAQRMELLNVHSVGCTASFTQTAGLAALKGPHSAVQMREAYRRRRDIVVSALNSMQGVHCSTPSGAFYAFPDVRALGLSSKEIAHRLLQEGLVAVLPGTDFGHAGEGFIRISYVSEENVLREGLDRMEKVFAKIRKEMRAKC